VQVAGEGAFDGGVLEGGSEDFAGGVAHARELLLAIWRDLRHVGDYREADFKVSGFQGFRA
jgi:hypothetical protein